MAVTRLDSYSIDNIYSAFTVVSKKHAESPSRQLRLAKHACRAAEAALCSFDCDVSSVVDLMVLSMSAYKFPSLLGRVKKVETKFITRGKLNRTIYVIKITKSSLGCAKLLSRIGAPFFVELFDFSKEVLVPTAIVGTRFTVEVSAGALITTLSVSATVVSAVRDLNKIYEGVYAEKHRKDGTGFLVVIQYSIHLLKCSLKISQVAIVVLGVSTPMISVTLILAMLGVGFVYDLSCTHQAQNYLTGVPLLTNGVPDEAENG